MNHREEFQRTIGYGEGAISQLRRNETPAYPRNYELWYTYCAGFNHALNKSINEILRTRGHIDPDEVEAVYNKFLAPSRLGDRIDEVSGKLSSEVETIADVISRTITSNADYCDALTGASSRLTNTDVPDDLKTLIANLIVATRKTEAVNRELETRLADSHHQIAELQVSLETIRYESQTDEMTTLANRRHFDLALEQAMIHAATTSAPLALLITDIDHFKIFNDTYGHQTGDQVLRLVGLAVKQHVRDQEVACRYGGEEFAIILPGEDLVGAVVRAERIRTSVMSKELVKRSTGENLGFITISIGVAAFRVGDSPATLIERADAALYAAKHGGRNRVCSEVELSILPHQQDRHDGSTSGVATAAAPPPPSRGDGEGI